MASRFRLLSTIFAVGMVVGVGGLMMLPPPDQKEWELFAVRRIADAPAPPCGKQTWPNADRKCLTWTAPQARTATVSPAPKHAKVDSGLITAAGNGKSGKAQRVARNPS